MKLKDGYVSRNLGEKTVLLSARSDAFQGIVEANSTASFIISLLREDTTREEIARKMMEEYDIDAIDEAYKAIDFVLEKLRSIDCLDE